MKKLTKFLLLTIMVAAVSASCNNSEKDSPVIETGKVEKVTKSSWGEADGKPVYLYTLTNKNGVEIKITNYGGTVTSWITPDKQGNKSNIVLGFDSLSGYLAKPPYFGALIGRYGNRIGKATFKIDTTTYKLAANNGVNHLHGGEK